MSHKQQQSHVFKKKDRAASAGRVNRGVGLSLVQTYKGHIAPCEEVKSRDSVAARKRHELDLCAGYPLQFGLPRDRVMDSAQIAAHVRAISRKPESRAESERYALAARTPQPQESDYRTSDPNRQVLDRRTGRPLIETVLSDANNESIAVPRHQGLKYFAQAYHDTDASPDDIPRAARHEMESMPASYKTNLVRTLCMLYPKFTAESRISRQLQAHMTGADARLYHGQSLQHGASRMGIAEEAGRRATKQVCARPNNVRVVSLMRGASPWAP